MTHLHDNPERTTSIGLMRYAVEFFEAAEVVDDEIGTRPGFEEFAPIPAMYLLGHSLELALKAFFLAKGVPLTDLRKNFGHNLSKLLASAHERGLSQDALQLEEAGALSALDYLYSTKQLEYIVTGAKTVPMYGPLETGARRVIHAIAPAIGYPIARLPRSDPA